MKRKWRTVQVPANLLNEVEKRIAQKGSLHTNISDFVSYAVHKELEVSRN